jgi:hypothetical protein
MFKSADGKVSMGTLLGWRSGNAETSGDLAESVGELDFGS